jgi:hypothetical protein
LTNILFKDGGAVLQVPLLNTAETVVASVLNRLSSV